MIKRTGGWVPYGTLLAALMVEAVRAQPTTPLVDCKPAIG